MTEACKVRGCLQDAPHPFIDPDMAKRKNKHEEPSGHYVIHWSSVSGDGWRVKHRMVRDEKFPECFWHIEIRLTDDPVTLNGQLGYEIYHRQFFGKVWLAQRIEFKRATTWKALGEAVRQLELKEKRTI